MPRQAQSEERARAGSLVGIIGPPPPAVKAATPAMRIAGVGMLLWLARSEGNAMVYTRAAAAISS